MHYVNDELTSKTIGGFPTRAIAVQSFLLLPPLQRWNTHTSHKHAVLIYTDVSTHTRKHTPVSSTSFVSILLQVQSSYFRLHYLLDLSFRYSSETSKDSEQLPSSQTLNKSIKLNEGRERNDSKRSCRD